MNPTIRSYGALACILGGVSLVLGARAVDVQLGSEYADDDRNAFAQEILVTNVEFPPVLTADGVTVAQSETDQYGEVVRTYVVPDLQLTPLVGVIPNGGYPVGVEHIVAERGVDSPPVVLRIDRRLQATLATALPDGVGAGILVDVDGQVLAAVDETAVPTEDPNTVASSTWHPTGAFELYVPAQASVLFDRPVAAGSSLKPFVVVEAIDAGVITNGTVFPSASSFQPPGGRSIDNFGGNECPEVDVVEGLARSCNNVAVDIGARLGGERVQAALLSFGLGQEPPFAVPAVTGSAELRSQWPRTVDETSLAVLGQGEARVTLGGLAIAYAGLASGVVPRPTLLADEELGPWLHPDSSDRARTIALDGMRAAVDQGTAYALADHDVLAKTGTATRDAAGASDGWVSVLFPSESPEYVLVVRLDGGQNSFTGSDAADVAAAALPGLRAALAEAGQ